MSHICAFCFLLSPFLQALTRPCVVFFPVPDIAYTTAFCFDNYHYHFPWTPLLTIPCCAPAVRDLRQRLCIELVPPAAKSPGSRDFIVVCLLLVGDRRPSLPYNFPLSPRLRPNMCNVRSAHIAPNPGSLPGIKHVIVAAGGNRGSAGAGSRTYRKLSRLWSLPLPLETAFLLPVYLTYIGEPGLCPFNDKIILAKEYFNHGRTTTLCTRPSVSCVMNIATMHLLPNHSRLIYRLLIYGNPFPDTRKRLQ